MKKAIIKNPRDPDENYREYPISGTFHWTDIPLSVVSIGLLIIILSL